ncbi:homoserine acetyltransferase [Exidia glandulosa HHB12029]|uniref:Homoserine acetyltransferase n=1 Tax=Exidia glandulosa HHB12029 TaxID=1314781 RepID=A0A165ETC9_EXIGL|nr:homoserine acetyltransferase [Exidia glandulosa HHB12029]
MFRLAHRLRQSSSCSTASTTLAGPLRRTNSVVRQASIRLASTAAARAPTFPCVDQHAARTARIQAATTSAASSTSDGGPEPPYARPTPKQYNLFTSTQPLALTYSSTPLPSHEVAYETWGTLNPARDNVILVHTGLSASSHAASNALNPAPGWWEKFIGPGKALDTDRFFIICANVLGGCYGSTGPSSVDATTEQPYATTFPVVSIFDMVRAQFALLDHLGVERLYASVGCSMGGMQSIAAGWMFPERVGRVVSVSGTARSGPASIAIRFAQRSVLMADPNWNNGFYYDGLPPHAGMKLARQIATITYRSGPEWEMRFGRRLRPVPSQQVVDPGRPRTPALCPDFLIETYLDHQGEEFCLKYDANSLIYVSKAMDLFDMSHSSLVELGMLDADSSTAKSESAKRQPQPHLSHHPPHLADLSRGLGARLARIPTLVLGVQSDVLFPVEQQRELADALRAAGNEEVTYYELGGVWGHDTFLLDVQNVGGAIRGFL